MMNHLAVMMRIHLAVMMNHLVVCFGLNHLAVGYHLVVGFGWNHLAVRIVHYSGHWNNKTTHTIDCSYKSSSVVSSSSEIGLNGGVFIFKWCEHIFWLRKSLCACVCEKCVYGLQYTCTKTYVSWTLVITPCLDLVFSDRVDDVHCPLVGHAHPQWTKVGKNLMWKIISSSWYTVNSPVLLCHCHSHTSSQILPFVPSWCLAGPVSGVPSKLGRSFTTQGQQFPN